MKALILTIFVLFTTNAFALDFTTDQLKPEQKILLIKALNQLEPEVLDAVLTDDALNWYIKQFQRGGMIDQLENQGFDVSIDPVEGIGGFDDPNAPTFL